MKILNICAYTWEIGGPARIIYDHTAEAIASGHQVDILSPMSAGDKLYPAPEGARIIPCLRTRPISTVYREFSLSLYRYLKKHASEYDIIHIHGIWHFGSLAPFLLKSNIPKIITIHGLLDRWAVNHHAWKKRLVSALYQKRLLGKADVIHINNTEEREDIRHYLGYLPDNLEIIPNGMRMADYNPLPAPGTFKRHFEIPKQQKMLLFMGRLNIKKGLDLLLPAFKNYHTQHADTILILAGPDDGYRAEAERFVKENNLTDAVRFVGMLTGEIKKAALADATVFTLPTYSEGFSIAVLEAMASNVPAVVSDRTGFGDFTRQYDAAAIPDLNVDDLTKKLETMLTDNEFRRNKANNAYRMVSELFDIRVVANQMLQTYQRAIEASKGN
jgi:glycosyltransferase involved in cell wall biosynthesis